MAALFAAGRGARVAAWSCSCTGPPLAAWIAMVRARSGAVDDAAARQVVRRHFDGHAVTRDDADEVLAHLAGDVGEDLVTALDLDAELGVGEGLDDRAFEDDGFFLGHKDSGKGIRARAVPGKAWHSRE